MSDVSIALFLASPHSVTLPVRISTDIEHPFDPLVTRSAPVLILIAAALVVVIVLTPRPGGGRGCRGA